MGLIVSIAILKNKIKKYMKKEVEKLIKKVKNCARDVYKELGPGWKECVYQQALEVGLREKGIDYEDQRVLPISYKNHVVGEGIPDLIVWLNKGKKRIAIVIDLKWEPYVKENHAQQVKKYMQELKKQIGTNEQVFDTGFVINFIKESGKKIENGIEEVGGVQILNVKV